MTEKKEMEKIDLTMTKNEALAMYDCLKNLASQKLGVFIKFDIGHDINRLKETYELIDSIRSDTSAIEGLEEYQNGLRKLMSRFFVDGVCPKENVQAFNVEAALHKDKNQETVAAIEAREKDINEMLKEKIEIFGLVKLKISDFPEELEFDITPIFKLLERE